MEDAAINLTAPVENLLLMIPGTATPVGRAIIFGGLGGTIAYTLRPSMSFNSDGTPRNWILTNPSDAEATLFPYWAYVIVPGVVFSILL